MNTLEIIRRKRDGHELTTEEIRHLIRGYTDGTIPDYQMSAWAMAVYFRGMTERETADLTMALVDSGDRVDLSGIPGRKVDKHSTGGVGDTTTLVVAPLVAAVGVPVAKLSGRGLGHTGGTVDKLESFRGFSTELDTTEFIELVNRTGLAVMGQTARLTPADKQLYALRDVTATVDSIPLIASSIMSKKIAAGADAIVLDVKTGDGAFMKREEDAVRLAEAMVSIGKQVGRTTVAVVSDMSQPLGFAVGNALEVKEAMDTLKGAGPADLTELSLQIGARMLVLSGAFHDAQAAREALVRCMQDGSAFAKFREFIVAQSGDPGQLDDPSLLPKAKHEIPLIAESSGFVTEIRAEEVGLAAMRLGAGRMTKADVIDHAVGVVLHRKVGDPVKAGDTLATLHVNQTATLEEVKKRLKEAIVIGERRVEPPTLIRCIVTEDGIIRP
ncbi:pyrimidine-nucleoside phosphorylase [Staphylospora marina]|uniref:pyrimidine-nucleoside phosphorylase n=1 Tax=Staphylospora marina TaxID=2490858 RepID=UPI000F5C2862|nr:pyrimidine-nucleoside phosphorylase [Staphylospora marina]